MLFDAAVMRGGKISHWLDLSVLLCFSPALEVQHWLQLDRGVLLPRARFGYVVACTLLRFLAKPLACSRPLTQLLVFSREDVGSRALSIPSLLLFLAAGRGVKSQSQVPESSPHPPLFLVIHCPVVAGHMQQLGQDVSPELLGGSCSSCSAHPLLQGQELLPSAWQGEGLQPVGWSLGMPVQAGLAFCTFAHLRVCLLHSEPTGREL